MSKKNNFNRAMKKAVHSADQYFSRDVKCTLRKLSHTIDRLQKNNIDISIELFPTENLYIGEVFGGSSLIPISGIITISGLQLAFGIFTRENSVRCHKIHLANEDWRFPSRTHTRTGTVHNLKQDKGWEEFTQNLMNWHARIEKMKSYDPKGVFNQSTPLKPTALIKKSTFPKPPKNS